MTRITGSSRRVVLVVVLAVLMIVAGRSRSSARPESQTPQATCVLTNPGYSGKCTQTTPLTQGATPLQACQAVLSCMNNPDCLKTYCNATTIRSGWQLESAK